jgi:hypothetical protein
MVKETINTYEITSNLGYIIMDNAINNQAMVRELLVG